MNTWGIERLKTCLFEKWRYSPKLKLRHGFNKTLLKVWASLYDWDDADVVAGSHKCRKTWRWICPVSPWDFLAPTIQDFFSAVAFRNILAQNTFKYH